jgi:hypothetical protein
MKAISGFPYALRRSCHLLVHVAAPWEGSLLQMPSSGSNLGSEASHPVDVGSIH